jgi:NADH:ubiquinone oxidoreductase subunit E
MTKKGKYKIAVCMGTACFVRGAGKVLDKFARDLNVPSGTTSEDGMWSLDGLRCVGACGLAPVGLVNGKVYGRIEEKDVQGIIDEYRAEGADA